MSTKNKTYDIENLSQICDIVNNDNIELLINDFAKWLIYYNGLMTKVRKENPNLEKIQNSKIAKCNFVWTDDGKNELTGVIVKNKFTGEQTTTLF